MFTLAIVGFGPRGLYSLESYLSELSDRLSFEDTLSQKSNLNDTRILIFESSKYLGTGTAWQPDQPDSNWNNISDRNLKNLQGREPIENQLFSIPAFPDFTSWSKASLNHTIDDSKDHYFKRNQLGAYLQERAQTLIDALIGNVIETIHGKVESIKKTNNQYLLATETNIYEAKNVLLTTGHLPNRSSDENVKLRKHSIKTNKQFISNPYAKAAYDLIPECESLIIKGMGLSMIDVVRLALQIKDDDFSNRDKSIFLDYNLNPNKVIAPYSLNGLPPIPKPIGKKIDNLLKPDQEDINSFKKRIEKSINAKETVVDDLLDGIAILANKTYDRLEKKSIETNLNAQELQKIISEWYSDPTLSHPAFISSKLPPVDYMKTFCAMSHGESAFSLDYIAGQTWRHLHPTLYELFSHAPVEEKTISEVIRIDEQLKQYTYGPPVESILQLISLAESGILNLEFVQDPDLKLVENGYQLSKNTARFKADLLVDSVLANPVWIELDDPLVNSLENNQLIEIVDPDLGIRTNEYGEHIRKGQVITGLYSLGRISKGSVLGTDAILECFNDDVKECAKHIANVSKS